jgi:hypothetical protein
MFYNSVKKLFSLSTMLRENKLVFCLIFFNAPVWFALALLVNVGAARKNFQRNNILAYLGRKAL